ncbi:MAG: OHCU decarboxylase [Blastopirellula sp.]|nr:MAG: OHCU decarboxylase [Blastopirellula sp.]
MRFATPQGFNSGDQFERYLRDTFDTLYAEGVAGSPKLMNIGLHCRLIGRPGRLAALKRFIKYAKSHDNVWYARRIDIAKHWMKHHPADTTSPRPSILDQHKLVEDYGGAFEHSPWIAERAFAAGLGAANDTANGLHHAMKIQFRLAESDERLGVLNAHPDLAGKLAVARQLTAESTSEQAGAGLSFLTDKERNSFLELNAQYTKKFGFPFIIAVKGLNKMQILNAFESRLKNSREDEFLTACTQVEKIALLRLKELLP